MCIALCTEQTRLQHTYVDQRDECRELAELKMGIAAGTTSTDKNTKSKLVSLFSECMGTKGWAVPSGVDDKKKDEKKDAATPASTTRQLAEGNPPPPQPVSQQTKDARTKRAAECAFARQAAESSMNAKKRAEACDLECTQQLKLSPEAPRPASCLEK